jgi:hypothetical protein
MISAYENSSKEELISTIILLKEELAQLKRMIFGVKSERFVPALVPEQATLGFEAQPEVVPVSTKKETITYTRENSKGNQVHMGRLPIPAHIERIKIEVAPQEDVKGLTCIGEEITEELEYKAASFYVNQYTRKKYVKAGGEGIIIGELPSRPIDKGIAGPGLLANIVIEKYVDHRVS